MIGLRTSRPARLISPYLLSLLPHSPSPPRPPPSAFRSPARHTRLYSAAPSVTPSPTQQPKSEPTSSRQPYKLYGETYPIDSYSNLPPTIISKLDRGLLTHPSHPLSILRQIIQDHFASATSIIHPNPVVSVFKNFDELGFASDHPGRAITDSYYLNKEYMLRAHTSAHEVETFRSGLNHWLLSADVYRRDEIDASHYPVFHQMEGTHVWSESELEGLPALNAKLAEELAGCPLIIEDPTQISESNPYQPSHDPRHAEQITQHLKHSLNSLIFRLFGQVAQAGGEPLRIRWIEAFFPFTTPSYEVEVWWGGEWLEILGCGVVMQKTLDLAGQSHKSGWAFGLGLERIAMVLYNIPDIRLFWSEDTRFLSQFKAGQITQFKPYSKYPPCYKDMSFWLPPKTVTVEAGSDAGGKIEEGTKGNGGRKEFHENDYCEIVREVAGDLVETVTLIDDFIHPKSKRQSKCYRLNYRSMDRSLSNEEVNALQDQVQRRVVEEMGIEIR